MACCKCCCGGVDCANGDQGKCCCGDSCCQEDEYCCSGSCQPDPCDACEDAGDCDPCGCPDGWFVVPPTGDPAGCCPDGSDWDPVTQTCGGSSPGPLQAWCCNGICSCVECCEVDEDCCQDAGKSPVPPCSDPANGYKCCPAGSVAWVDDMGDARFGNCVDDCGVTGNVIAGPGSFGSCCDGECYAGSPCPP